MLDQGWNIAKQIQLMDKTGHQRRIIGLQVTGPNHSVTLPHKQKQKKISTIDIILSFSLNLLQKLVVFLSCCFIAELSTIACKGEKVSQLLKHAHSCKGLRNVIKMGSQITQEESKTAEGLGIKLISFADLEVSSSVAWRCVGHVAVCKGLIFRELDFILV